MSENKESAFPYEFGNARRGKGMSLRDYFAAAAIQGIMANPATILSEVFKDAEGWHSPERITDFAYYTADAMLKRRIEPE